MSDYAIDVGDILGEFRLLVAVSGILFGFLLNVAVFKGGEEASVQAFLTILALSFAAISVLIFLLPPVYHHSRSFPIMHEEKRKLYFRSHQFALYGILTLILTIYFSLVLAFYSLASWQSFILAAVILGVPASLFRLRRRL